MRSKGHTGSRNGFAAAPPSCLPCPMQTALAHFDTVRALPDFEDLDPQLAEALVSRYEAGRDQALEGEGYA